MSQTNLFFCNKNPKKCQMTAVSTKMNHKQLDDRYFFLVRLYHQQYSADE